MANQIDQPINDETPISADDEFASEMATEKLTAKKQKKQLVLKEFKTKLRTAKEGLKSRNQFKIIDAKTESDEEESAYQPQPDMKR